jgi:hypothetical protein
VKDESSVIGKSSLKKYSNLSFPPFCDMPNEFDSEEEATRDYIPFCDGKWGGKDRKIYRLVQRLNVFLFLIYIPWSVPIQYTTKTTLPSN